MSTVPWSFNLHFYDLGLGDELKDEKAELAAALVEANKCFAAMHELGATMVRTDFPWLLLEPDEEKGFSPAVLEFCRHYVEAAQAHGIEVICILYQVPKWAKDICKKNPDDFYPLYKRYCKTVATEMRGKVRHYQLWNEPNNLPLYLSDKKDGFALVLDFPRLFNAAEDGLFEAGYHDWVCSINFLINVLTELEEARILVDGFFGTAVKTLEFLYSLIAWSLSDADKAAFQRVVSNLGCLENNVANLFSWSRGIDYFVTSNHAINPHNHINIYGLDHYPGTWTARPYEDWSPLQTAADILARHPVPAHPKLVAVAETGYTTWGMDGILKPSIEYIEKVATAIAMIMIQPILDQLYAILRLLPQPLQDAVKSLEILISKFIDSLCVILTPAIVDFLKSIYLNDHTYDEQCLWIERSLKGLHDHPQFAALQYVNWYELKDHDSNPPVFPTDFTDPIGMIEKIFLIPEMKFGILLRDRTHKKAYSLLRQAIQKG